MRAYASSIQWTVVSACGLGLGTARRNLAVAVIPLDDYTATIARKAAVDGYAGLYECPL